MSSEESLTPAAMAGCVCKACAAKRAGAERPPSARINGYHHGPASGWREHRVASDPADATAPTFGVELETSVGDAAASGRPQPPSRAYSASGEYVGTDEWEASYPQRLAAYDRELARWTERNRMLGDLTADEAAGLAEPSRFWHPEHDGSVSGPEMVSHPATLAYWRRVRPGVASMMRTMLHGGVRSHDAGTCGAHVNIGTSAFADADHLYRFASLVYADPRWTTRMAMRTHVQVARWSRFEYLADEGNRREWAEAVLRRGHASQNRYEALNASNRGRIEFRVPRGTLRVDRFYARLEWVAAMVEYTRDAGRRVSVGEFCRWAAASGEYPELTAYLSERFPLRLAPR